MAAAAVERHLKFSVASLQLSVQYSGNTVNSAKTAKTAKNAIAIRDFDGGVEGANCRTFTKFCKFTVHF